jgi:hypothetical protein
MQVQQPQTVVHVPLEEAVVPNCNDDLGTMQNLDAPKSTNTNTNAEIPSPPQDVGVLGVDAACTNNTPAGNESQSAQSLATEESAAQDALLSTDSNISMQGGRLWQAAALEAERWGRTMDSTVMPSASQEMEGNSRRGGPTGPGSRFAETFMERTRSRAHHYHSYRRTANDSH